jgi:hypothetical protein
MEKILFLAILLLSTTVSASERGQALVDVDKVLKAAYCIGSLKNSLEWAKSEFPTTDNLGNEIADLVDEKGRLIADMTARLKRLQLYVATYIPEMPPRALMMLSASQEYGKLDEITCNKLKLQSCQPQKSPDPNLPSYYNCLNSFDVCKKLDSCKDLELPF